MPVDAMTEVVSLYGAYPPMSKLQSGVRVHNYPQDLSVREFFQWTISPMTRRLTGRDLASE